MGDLAQSQAYVFVIYILSGILIGIFFDIFRVYRRSFKTPDFITYIQDILFWVLTGIFLLFVIFKFNNGELRWYIFLGALLGTLLYMLIFSKHFIKINVAILTFIKNIFLKIWEIIMIPIRWIRKIVFKPISFVFINVRKLGKQLLCRILCMLKPKKKHLKPEKNT